MTFTFNSLLSWVLHIIKSAIPVIVGIVVERINKLIERKDEDENPEEKEKDN